MSLPSHPRRARQREEIVPVRYQPPGGYGLEVEVKEAVVEAGRPSVPFLGVPERADFHVFIYVTSGTLRHWIDLEATHGKAGSVVTVRPGQVQQWELKGRWRGWLVLFRPEFVRTRPDRRELSLAAMLDALPSHIALSRSAQQAVRDVISRMASDAQRTTARSELNALLRSQLEELILRLRLAHIGVHSEALRESEIDGRFRRFRTAVEKHHAQIHDVATYARLLGCAEKTLSRASHHGSGLPAKAFISNRVTLEAKRLLAHTDLPVANVAVMLGFDEPTNFGKFFRRMAGCTPGVFRGRHRPEGQGGH